MGKRKLGNTTFYQCDWTGFPMKTAHCYWPVWTSSNKLQKKGAYCNWESVVADVNAAQLPDEQHTRIMAHICQICGEEPEPAPHYEQLSHTKGTMTEREFHKACTAQTKAIYGVLIKHTGEVTEKTIDADEDCFAKAISDTFPSTLQCFYSTRKKSVKGVDKELCVWYGADPEKKSLNTTASNLFKMSLYGHVLIVQVSREASFRPRERYISYTKAEYDEYFSKRRKKAETQSLSSAQYSKLKAQMQDDLNHYESTASQTAVPPQQMSTQTTARKTDGRSLAAKVKARAAPSGLPAIPPPPAAPLQTA